MAGKGADGVGPHLRTLADLREVMEAIPLPRVVIDASEAIRCVNGPACTLLGFAEADLIGRTIDILVPEGRGAHADELRRQWADSPTAGTLGQGLDLHARRADGTEVPIELHVVPWTIDEGRVVVVSLHDLTAAQHDSRLFRALLDATPDPVVIVDQAGTIRLVNVAAEQRFGYSRDEIVGSPVELLVPTRLAEGHQRLRVDVVEGPRLQSLGHGEMTYARHKDGTEFPIDISLASISTEEGQLIIADVHDLTDQLAAVDAVRTAREHESAMAATNKAKDEILATVSHELRTPLASITGFCELILEIPDLDPEVERFASIVARNARRETRLVEDLLTLVHINERGLSVRLKSTDLAELIREAAVSTEPQATAHELSLDVDLPAKPVIVECDPDRIAQVLDSLLSNALKFTPAGGRIRLALEEDASTATARILVADTGIGIGDSPERVFERLYRSPRAIAREVPGAGLGLSIAAAIAAAHRGDIRVVKSDDTGTTFSVELPTAPDTATAAPPDEA